jgi:hypothetical protein
MNDHTATTGYTFAEAKVLIAPLVGWAPEDVRHFVIVVLDKDSRAGFGSSPGVKPRDVPRILRGMADGIEKAVTS